MLTDSKLPPLPPYLYGRECGEKERVYTAKQMREYARAVEAAAYERAMKACEDRMVPDNAGCDYIDGCGDCRDAIRALAQAKEMEL